MTDYPAIEFATIISAEPHTSPGTGTRYLYLNLRTDELLEGPEHSPTDCVFASIKVSSAGALTRALNTTAPEQIDRPFLDSLLGRRLRVMVGLEYHPPIVRFKVLHFYPEKGSIVEHIQPKESILLQITRKYISDYDSLDASEKEEALRNVQMVLEVAEEVTGLDILDDKTD